MKIFDSERRRRIQSFPMELAKEIALRYPPSVDNQKGKRPSVNRLTRITEDACLKAVEFQKTHRLGWFRRAWLANRFRWTLTEMGYSSQFVLLATEALVVHISRK